jgi:uncharacterized protein with ATP-grasp and redox domains
MDQALRVARISTEDESVHLAVARSVAALLPQMNMRLTPPENSVAVYSAIAAITGNPDPYLATKQASNQQALAILPDLLREVAGAGTPLIAAFRLAIAGNIIDYGAMRSFDVDAALRRARTVPFVIDESQQLVDFVGGLPIKAKVLYLADNSGEIVYDSLVVRTLAALGLDVCVAVKARPIINDALLADALACDLDQYARIISNGTACPGTPLALCTPDFLEEFQQADLVISKGQGNFETLSEEVSRMRAAVYFLLTVKCPVVGAHLAALVGKSVEELPGHGEMALFSGKRGNGKILIDKQWMDR